MIRKGRSKSVLVDKLCNELSIQLLKKRCFRKNAVGVMVNYMDYGLPYDEMICLFPPTIKDMETIHKRIINIFKSYR